MFASNSLWNQFQGINNLNLKWDTPLESADTFFLPQFLRKNIYLTMMSSILSFFQIIAICFHLHLFSTFKKKTPYEES